jgi:hypothetical protein
MNLYDKENLLVFKTKLSWDLYYFQYWDLDYLWYSKPAKIAEFIRIWNSEPFLLTKPLLLIKLPKINWIYNKRELWNFISDEIEKNRLYLDRVWVKLWKQLKEYFLNDEISYYFKEQKVDEKYVWVKVPKKYKFLIDFFFGEEPWEQIEEEDEKPP